MKLIFALGNPEANYEKTRHNVGFQIVDSLATEKGISFSQKDKFKALIAEASIDHEKVVLVKPTTYYNHVGESLHSLIDFYKLEAEDVLIIHDELALPFGTLRTRIGGSDAGNNGIKSVNTHGGKHSARLRIGIANDKRSLIGDTDFVLNAFSKDERAVLKEVVIPTALQQISTFLEQNLTAHSIRTLPEPELGEKSST